MTAPPNAMAITVTAVNIKAINNSIVNNIIIVYLLTIAADFFAEVKKERVKLYVVQLLFK